MKKGAVRREWHEDDGLEEAVDLALNDVDELLIDVEHQDRQVVEVAQRRGRVL